MTLDNMTGITKGSYTGSDLFCKSQLITCNRVKECNGVCPFEDALKHADKEMDEQTVIDHDRDWIIGCIKHDGFIKTDRFDKANQIILDALSADAVQGEWIPCSKRLPSEDEIVNITWVNHNPPPYYADIAEKPFVASGLRYRDKWYWYSSVCQDLHQDFDLIDKDIEVIAWQPLPKPYKGGDDNNEID